MPAGDMRRVLVIAELLLPEKKLNDTTVPNLENMPAILSDGLVAHYGTGEYLAVVHEIRERTDRSIFHGG